MNRTHAGIGSGILATLTLSEVSIWLGMGATFLTILCLFPSAVMNWRNLILNYEKFSTETGKSGFIYFALFCSGVLRPLPKSISSLENQNTQPD